MGQPIADGGGLHILPQAGIHPIALRGKTGRGGQQGQRADRHRQAMAPTGWGACDAGGDGLHPAIVNASGWAAKETIYA